MNDTDVYDEYSHEEILQGVVRHLLTTDDLDELCSDADLPVLLTDADDQPILIIGAQTYRDAGVLSMNRGVMVEFSDGSAFTLTITAYRRPSQDVGLRRRGVQRRRG